jgi:hypothetical protein
MQDIRANVVGIVMNGVPVSNYKYYDNSYYQDAEQPEFDQVGSTILHLD